MAPFIERTSREGTNTGKTGDAAARRPASRAMQKFHAVVSRLRFLVGRDAAGRWVAVERAGRAGGFFASREAALRYAADESDHRPGAVRLSRRPIAFPF